MEESHSKKMFRHESAQGTGAEPAYNIFKDNELVAEVRGIEVSSQTVIPMRELNDYEEDKLQEYIKKYVHEQE